MTPSDWAASVQAVGSIAAIGVAVWVPWKIHTREFDAARRSREAYREILRDALNDLQTPLRLLVEFGARKFEPTDEIKAGVPVQWSDQDKQIALEMASDMRAALSTMTHAASILDELESIDGIDRFEVIRALFHLRRKLRDYLPLGNRESQLLGEHPTPRVVQIAIAKLGDPTEDLIAAVEHALAALQDKQ